jgi:hypothetical protein
MIDLHESMYEWMSYYQLRPHKVAWKPFNISCTLSAVRITNVYLINALESAFYKARHIKRRQTTKINIIKVMRGTE